MASSSTNTVADSLSQLTKILPGEHQGKLEALLKRSNYSVDAALNTYFTSGLESIPANDDEPAAGAGAGGSSGQGQGQGSDRKRKRQQAHGGRDVVGSSSSEPGPGGSRSNSSSNSSSSSASQRRPHSHAPLAERMRPRSLDHLVGQADGLNDLVRRSFELDSLPNMLLWGPPGCGKTSFASVVSAKTKCVFRAISAAKCGVAELRQELDRARKTRSLTGTRTLLFVDEIHRWSKSQQDALLLDVEKGAVTLLGATTENPSFSLNNAILSRCRLVVFQKLTTAGIVQILTRAIAEEYGDGVAAIVGAEGGKQSQGGDGDSNGDGMEEASSSSCSSGSSSNKEPHAVASVLVKPDALHALAAAADGDARVALNALELCITSDASVAGAGAGARGAATNDGAHDSSGSLAQKPRTVTVETIKAAMQRRSLYDRNGEYHYDLISAMHKSLRGGDADAALYWTTRMLEGGEDPRYVTRRLMRFASEDVGLADPNALVQAVAADRCVAAIGMPEGGVVIAQCVVYLALAPKSVAVYRAYKAAVQACRAEPHAEVPLHIRNAPTKMMKALDYGKGYTYNPSAGYSRGCEQGYLPEEVVRRAMAARKAGAAKGAVPAAAAAKASAASAASGTAAGAFAQGTAAGRRCGPFFDPTDCEPGHTLHFVSNDYQ